MKFNWDNIVFQMLGKLVDCVWVSNFMGDLLHSGFYDRGSDHRAVLHGT